jgi:uncharacterized protein (DUF2345 family)
MRVLGAAASGALAPALTKSYDEQIQLLTDSGTPVANTKYKIVSASGATTTGTTDAQGKTSRVSTDAAEPLQIYLVS